MPSNSTTRHETLEQTEVECWDVPEFIAVLGQRGKLHQSSGRSHLLQQVQPVAVHLFVTDTCEGRTQKNIRNSRLSVEAFLETRDELSISRRRGSLASSFPAGIVRQQ